jgi:hypothetical protein
MSLTTPALIGYFAFSADPSIIAAPLPVPPVAIRPVATTDPNWNGLLASLNVNGFWTAVGVVQLRLGPPVLTGAGLPALDPSSDAWRYSQTPASGPGVPVPVGTPGGSTMVTCTAYGGPVPVITKVDANTWLLTGIVVAAGAAVFFKVEAVAGIVS